MIHSYRPARLVGAIVLLSAAVIGAGNAGAQASSYPNRPIKLLVSTAPGGSGDTLARVLGEKLSTIWGQPVIVENRTGANGIIATQALVKAPPDGYTIFLSLSSMVQNLLLQSNPGYKLDDLAPATMVTINPMALAVGNGTKATTVEELVRIARAEPGKVSYGTFGTGSSAHVIGAGLAKNAKVEMVHVPYKGESASFPDLVSGQLAMSFGTVGFYSAQATAGKIRILAVTSPHRLKNYPNVPTLGEAGYPDVNLAGWFGMFLPAATPKPIIDKVSADVRRAIAMPDLEARIYEMGLEPVGDSPTEFRAKLQSEMTHWTRVIKETGIRLD
jgi:tripartite-type tricarboxylate transporter receptor subunit TctC